MKYFVYEIAGISNVNKVLPRNGNWYYTYTKNGNIKIYGSPSKPTIFSPKTFEQKITARGGRILGINNLIKLKQEKMADTTNSSTEELINIEQGIETFLEEISEKELESNYSKLELTSNNSIVDDTTFPTELANNLGLRINKEIKVKIKLLLEQIKKSLKSGKVLTAVYSPPSCTPQASAKTITIEKKDCIPAKLKVTTEILIDETKVLSTKDYTISDNLFSSQDVIDALSEFSAGRTYLNGLTSSTETFTPKS